MHRTRRLLQSFPGLGPKKFLLPNDTFWDRVVSSLQGAWMHLTDQNARDKYEELVATKVIQDTVLAQSQGGHARTMALFWNLQNPLWAKHGLDIHEFVQGVGPALESFQDTLGQLVSEMNQQQPTAVKEAEESKEEDTESKHISGKSISSSIWAIPAIGGDNEWRQQAKQDPNSLAARLQKMVTDSAFDDHFFGAKLFQALTSSRGSGGGYLNYVPGSGVVQSVALLNARVLEMPLPSDEQIEGDHPEFAASEGREQPRPVAARMDVLYEITQQYRPSAASATDAVDPLSTAEQYKVVKNEDGGSDNDSATTDGNKKEDAKQSSKDKNEEAASASAKISDDSPAAAAASEPVTTTAGSTTEDKGDDVRQAASEPSTTSTATAGTTTDDKQATEDKASAAASVKMETAKDEKNQTANKTTSGGGETISETTLAVAVLEGWLYGGPEKDLRWKVSLIRDAYEFT